MSTRSNLLVIKKDSENKNIVTQYYHHCDGYLEGVGEELRMFAIISVGLSLITNEGIENSITKVLETNSRYELEDDYNLSDYNGLHGDIEYLYVMDVSKYSCEDIVSLYYIKTCLDWNKRINLVGDIIKYICIPERKINLQKSLREK